MDAIRRAIASATITFGPTDDVVSGQWQKATKQINGPPR